MDPLKGIFAAIMWIYYTVYCTVETLVVTRTYCLSVVSSANITSDPWRRQGNQKTKRGRRSSATSWLDGGIWAETRDSFQRRSLWQVVVYFRRWDQSRTAPFGLTACKWVAGEVYMAVCDWTGTKSEFQQGRGGVMILTSVVRVRRRTDFLIMQRAKTLFNN